MTLLLVPLVLIGPVMLLAAAVVALVRQGPLGAVAAVALLTAVALACRWTWRRCCAWWAGTRAPERPAGAPRPRAVHLAPRADGHRALHPRTGDSARPQG